MAKRQYAITWNIYVSEPVVEFEPSKVWASFTSSVNTEPDGKASQSMHFRREFPNTPEGRLDALQWITDMYKSEAAAGRVAT